MTQFQTQKWTIFGALFELQLWTILGGEGGQKKLPILAQLGTSWEPGWAQNWSKKIQFWAKKKPKSIQKSIEKKVLNIPT